MNTATKLIEKAKETKKTIVTAESCTGGMIAAALTDVTGSSAVLDGGFVTYSNRSKLTMLGAQAVTLADHGAVSEDVAAQMASGALERSSAQLAVAVTGIAGPGGSDHKPEGRVCFGLAQTGYCVNAETVDFGALGRAKVREAARDHALALLLKALDRK